MKISTDTSRRVADDEILFVALVLMFGEPPRSPIKGATASDMFGMPIGEKNLDAALRFIHDIGNYSRQIKDMMRELGHNPSLGLFTEYMHWCKENWNGKANKKVRG